MRRQRTLSNYNSVVRHNSKQHCPQDIVCRQCCLCVDRLQKQNKILLQKNWSLSKQKETMMKEIMRLNKVIKGWQKRERELSNLQEVKRRLRQEIKAQVEDKRKVDDMLTKQKISSLKKERDTLHQEKEELLEQLENFDKKFESATKELKRQEQLYKKLQQQHQEKCDQLDRKEQVITKLVNRTGQLEAALKDKTNTITRIQKALASTEQNYMMERAKNSDTQYELTRLKEQAKTVSRSLDILKKETQQKQASIHELAQKNGKLDKLVHNLDSTIASYTVLEKELRTRVLATEQYAIQKELEVKQVQADFYDVVYRRSF